MSDALEVVGLACVPCSRIQFVLLYFTVGVFLDGSVETSV